MSAELLDSELWKTISNIIDQDFGHDITRKISLNRIPVSIEKKKYLSVYLIPEDWIEILDKINTFEIQSMGLWLGEYDGSDFRISLIAAQKIALDTAAYLIVSSHAAEAFTYGNSILRESVVELPENLSRNQRVLVLNEEKECLGIAILSVDANKLDRLGSDKLVAKNLVDIGWYIRRLG
ncbi:MAG: hypothetical protein GF411_07820 [Candidatus Lokiarchaeota archaeon]|nr:hypothetical protein [Candidatus Lokiarchaeota archaeon]